MQFIQMFGKPGQIGMMPLPLMCCMLMGFFHVCQWPESLCLLFSLAFLYSIAMAPTRKLHPVLWHPVLWLTLQGGCGNTWRSSKQGYKNDPESRKQALWRNLIDSVYQRGSRELTQLLCRDTHEILSFHLGICDYDSPFLLSFVGRGESIVGCTILGGIFMSALRE